MSKFFPGGYQFEGSANPVSIKPRGISFPNQSHYNPEPTKQALDQALAEARLGADTSIAEIIADVMSIEKGDIDFAVKGRPTEEVVEQKLELENDDTSLPTPNENEVSEYDYMFYTRGGEGNKKTIDKRFQDWFKKTDKSPRSIEVSIKANGYVQVDLMIGERRIPNCSSFLSTVFGIDIVVKEGMPYITSTKLKHLYCKYLPLISTPGSSTNIDMICLQGVRLTPELSRVNRAES